MSEKFYTVGIIKPNCVLDGREGEMIKDNYWVMVRCGDCL